jgi:hypothetical protein
VSDFLANLLERSLDSHENTGSAAVRPYRPSVFEPASEPPPMETSEHAIISPAADIVPQSVPAVAPATPATTPQPPLRAPPSHPFPAPSEAPTDRAERTIALPVGTPPPSTHEPPVHNIRTIVERETRHIETIVERSTSTQIVSPAIPAPPVAHVMQPEPIQSAAPPRPAFVPVPVGPGPDVTTPRQIAEPRSPARNLHAPVRDLTPEIRRRAPVEPAAATPPPAAPAAIEITIGRLEVRAVAPPPGAANNRSQRGPKLGLDEYLRQRSRGAA